MIIQIVSVVILVRWLVHTESRLLEQTERCDACIERQKAGLKPACVKICPTGALLLLSEEEFQARQKDEQKKNVVKMMEKQLAR